MSLGTSIALGSRGKTGDCRYPMELMNRHECSQALEPGSPHVHPVPTSYNLCAKHSRPLALFPHQWNANNSSANHRDVKITGGGSFSWGCPNKLPQTGGLRITDFIPSQSRNRKVKSRYQQGHTPSRSQGGEAFLTTPVSAGSRPIFSSGYIPVSASS